MKLLEVQKLSIPDILVIKFGRFMDHRGYFTETFRLDDYRTNPELKDAFEGVNFVQVNESFSQKDVVRGLHFQWNPFMGKMVRTIKGHMVDVVADVRKGSPTYGKIIMYDMPADESMEHNEWIWVPPGFAHGNFFKEPTQIEYMCSGQYSPGCEGGISPLSDDLDWALCDDSLKADFEKLTKGNVLITDKDRDAPNLKAWEADERSDNFIYGKC